MFKFFVVMVSNNNKCLFFLLNVSTNISNVKNDHISCDFCF